jgi:hypothetical protein
MVPCAVDRAGSGAEIRALRFGNAAQKCLPLLQGTALRPAAVWPFVADSSRINEIAGMPAYKIEERADAQGRIHRLASIRYGSIRVKWEEEFGEWQENRWLSQTRHFINGPFGRFVAAAEVHPEGTGSRLGRRDAPT